MRRISRTVSASFQVWYGPGFFNGGGLGIVGGDDILPHPGLEQVLETYYKYAVSSLLWVTLDYQFLVDPGYYRDRGRSRSAPSVCTPSFDD